MALEASHIRSAIDLKSLFEIKNDCDYIRGAIYPDSRYVTDVSREKTHEHATDNVSNDFAAGWQTHLWVDSVQYDLISEKFPAICELSGKQEWVQRTAIKLVQDCIDTKIFDIEATLDCLLNIETPHNENPQKIRMYHDAIHDLYVDPKNITPESYKLLWKQWSLDTQGAQRVIEAAGKLQQDKENIKIISSIYDKTISQIARGH